MWINLRLITSNWHCVRIVFVELGVRSRTSEDTRMWAAEADVEAALQLLEVEKVTGVVL